MKEQPSAYSHHFETLVALVTFLATCEIHDNAQQQRDNATAAELVRWLELDTAEVKTVLDEFNGLFRKSIDVHLTGQEKDHRYALVLRYARRKYFDDSQPRWGNPLSNEELFHLLSFIGNKVREEQENQRMRTREEEESKRQKNANRVTIFGIGLTFLTSLLSLLVLLFK